MIQKDSNPLVNRIKEIKNEGRMALCGYFPAGYPYPPTFQLYIERLHGLDIVEYGIPSMNPFLDDPLISRAHNLMANTFGISTKTALNLIGSIKKPMCPGFVMTYAKDGREFQGFLKKCSQKNIHGILAPDISQDEAWKVSKMAGINNLAYIGFVHPGMDDDAIIDAIRISDIVYVKVSSGKTGAKAELTLPVLARLNSFVEKLRARKKTLLIAAGIGVQTPEQLRLMKKLNLDIVILGASIMEKIEEGYESLENLLTTFKNETYRIKLNSKAYD